MFGKLKNLLMGKGLNGQSNVAAKSRLHFVIVQDRSGLSSDEMTSFKRELIDVIKKFFMIDDEGLEVNYQRDSGSTTLQISSPVLRRKEEAQAAAAKKGKAAKEATPQTAQV